MPDPANRSGAQIHAALRHAIEAGRASLVSDISSVAEGPGLGHWTIDVSMTFTHTTGSPVEPGLEAVLAVAARDKSQERYPDMQHPGETWAPENPLVLTPGKVFCLGVRKPAGAQRKVLHVAYIRVRELD